MSRLPVISGRKCIKALEKAGFYVKRQAGSHVILRRDDPFAQVVVPDHEKLDRGTLQAIVKHAGLTAEDYVRQGEEIRDESQNNSRREDDQCGIENKRLIVE